MENIHSNRLEKMAKLGIALTITTGIAATLYLACTKKIPSAKETNYTTQTEVYQEKNYKP